MKILIIFAAIVAVSWGQENMQQLYRLVQERHALNQATTAIEAVCPGRGDEFEYTVYPNITACMKTYNEDQDTICSFIRNRFKTCLIPMHNMFENCLPNHMKYVPELTTDMIVSIINQACRSTGEELMELSSKCVRNPSTNLDRCLNMAKGKISRVKEGVNKFPTKQEFCENEIRPVVNCLESFIKNSCGNPVTQGAFLKFLDALVDPCKNVENEIEYAAISK